VRAVRATRIAVEAEALRFRLQARRMAIRTLLGVAASTFLLGALVLAHVAVWYWLRDRVALMADATAVWMAAGDLVIVGVFALLALRLGPGRVETEALLVRQQACRVLSGTVVWPMLALRLLRLVRRHRTKP
jgi:hypothetical protein